jgi:hypothetical protein
VTSSSQPCTLLAYRVPPKAQSSAESTDRPSGEVSTRAKLSNAFSVPVFKFRASRLRVATVYDGRIVMRHQRRLSSTSASPNPTSTVPVARSSVWDTSGRRNQRERTRRETKQTEPAIAAVASVSRRSWRLKAPLLIGGAIVVPLLHVGAIRGRCATDIEHQSAVYRKNAVVASCGRLQSPLLV